MHGLSVEPFWPADVPSYTGHPGESEADMRFTSLRHLVLPTLAALLVTSAAAAQSAGVSVQFHDDGTVSLQARNAPLRTILQEWARTGRTTFINAERVTGVPMTIELTNVTERAALATLLRGTSGYIVGARPVATTGASSYDRIMILPQSSTPPTARVVSSSPSPTTQPPAPIAFVPGDPDDNQDPNSRVLTAQQLQNQLAARAAEAQRQVQGQQGQQAPPTQDQMARPVTQPTATPANPFFQGTSGRPGEIAPVPQQPRNPLRPNGDPEP